MRIICDVLNEKTVNLDKVRSGVIQQFQARKSCATVINGNFKALRTIRIENAGNFFVILQFVLFRNLETNRILR